MGSFAACKYAEKSRGVGLDNFAKQPSYSIRHHMYQWFKTWFLDGWVTEGPQLASPPGIVKYFTTCIQCHRVFPHWLASMTVKEAKKRGKLGCKCGGMRIQPTIIPAYQSFWWFVVRGWLCRHILTHQRIWDPRVPVLEHDLT